MQQMFNMVRELLEEKDSEKITALFKKIERQEDSSDKLEMEIARFLEQVSSRHLSDSTKMKVRQMLREISELESVGDSCYNLARTLKRRDESGRNFTPALYTRLRALMELDADALSQMNVVMAGQNGDHAIRDTYRIENEINQLRRSLNDENMRGVDEGDYDYTVYTLFADMVNECEKLGDYVVNVVEARLGMIKQIQ